MSNASRDGDNSYPNGSKYRSQRSADSIFDTIVVGWSASEGPLHGWAGRMKGFLGACAAKFSRQIQKTKTMRQRTNAKREENKKGNHGASSSHEEMIPERSTALLSD